MSHSPDPLPPCAPLTALIASTVALKYVDNITIPDASPSPAASSPSGSGSSTDGTVSDTSVDVAPAAADGSSGDGAAGSGGSRKPRHWVVVVSVVGGVVGAAVLAGTGEAAPSSWQHVHLQLRSCKAE